MISIIIPVLNEQKVLGNTLDRLFEQAGEIEVIVVDGGSDDRSSAIAGSYPCVTVLPAPRGRARQMNAGAAVANGEWLLFLHADTLLPANALLTIAQLDTKQMAGCFRQQFSDQRFLLRAISWMHNWRCNHSHIIYGDQAMFVRRSLFDTLGGFPEEPILEDIRFSERLLNVTEPVLLDETVITDARKFTQRGVLKSFAEICLILSCYTLRLPIRGRGFFSAIR